MPVEAAERLDNRTPLKIEKPISGGANEIGGTGEVNLTEEECTGLGGTVKELASCGRSGKVACVTVDSDGVVRYLCFRKARK